MVKALSLRIKFTLDMVHRLYGIKLTNGRQAVLGALTNRSELSYEQPRVVARGVRVKARVNRNVKGGGQSNSDLFAGLSSGRSFTLGRRQVQICRGVFGIFF